MGGKTTSSTGEANAGSGFGGTKAVQESDEGAEKERAVQGYGGKEDASREVGA
jgi:hypothetical protein